MAVLYPHTTLLARTVTATVHSRIYNSLFQPLLNALALASDVERPIEADPSEPVYPHIIMGCCAGDRGVEERLTTKALRRDVLSGLFRAAADPDANEVDRRKIYKVWREEGGDDEDEDE